MIRWKTRAKRDTGRKKNKIILRESITSKIINLLIDPKPKVAFEAGYPDHRIYGVEIDLTLSNANAYDYGDVTTETIPNTKAEDGLIPLPKASNIYNIEPEQLREMCRTGVIEANKVSNRWIIKEASLRIFLKAAINAKVNKRKS